MPKMKTHSGAKKRFKVTAKGHVKHKQAHKSHLLSHEATKRKRRLRAGLVVLDHSRHVRALGSCQMQAGQMRQRLGGVEILVGPQRDALARRLRASLGSQALYMSARTS